MKRITVILALLVLTMLGAHSQVTILNLPFQYSQNFDSLGVLDTAWQDNQTLQGWRIISSTGPVTTLVSNFTDLGVVRNAGNSAEANRSLGSAADAMNDFYYGVQFVNNSQFIITNVDISFDGEQWVDTTSPANNTLNFFFRVGGNDFLATNTGWTAFMPLNFDSLSEGNAVFLDGHLDGNKVNLSDSISSIAVNPGESFWIRWFDPNDTGDDHTLAIDNLTINFTGISANPGPEPEPNLTNSPALSDVQLILKKPNLSKTLNFVGAKGFPFKAQIAATTSTITRLSYVAFATVTPPTNLVFTPAGLFKTTKGKLAKKGIKYLAKHKGGANKPGIGITPDTASVTLIVKLDSTQSTNLTNSIFFTNTLTSKVR